MLEVDLVRSSILLQTQKFHNKDWVRAMAVLFCREAVELGFVLTSLVSAVLLICYYKL